MTSLGRTPKIAAISIGLLLPLSFPRPSTAQESKAEWLKKFKQARYVVRAWEGSIERYQLSLLTDSLSGETVDTMINWREKAKASVADLKGCLPEYQGACELLDQIIVLLGKQESLCTGKEYVMAHIGQWRENKTKIQELHKQLSDILKL